MKTELEQQTRDVILSISGTHTTYGEEPEQVELKTAGKLCRVEGGFDVHYEESELTGMEGTTTTFRLREGRIALVRTGAVEMALEFTPGGASESLYDIGEGALLVRVATRKLELDLGWDGGAFDLNWFRSAREAVGEAVFERLYVAAKYITDGAKHSRARKYADAALGRLSVEDAEKQIREKRSKDLLMAYPLIPLSGEDDTLRRFLFIQQFLKESRQFGAQRSLSERRACEMALKNLAENSGDQDVIRLTLRMEAKLSENRLALLEPRSVEDAVVRLELTEEGSAAIVCEKDGKRLKSVPARLKKNEAIVQLAAAQKELTEQYRRTRAFMEDAMTDEVALTGAALSQTQVQFLYYRLLAR